MMSEESTTPDLVELIRRVLRLIVAGAKGHAGELGCARCGRVHIADGARDRRARSRALRGYLRDECCQGRGYVRQVRKLTVRMITTPR